MADTVERVERPGLYIMVFFTLLNSCAAESVATKHNDELRRIADAVCTAPAGKSAYLPTEN